MIEFVCSGCGKKFLVGDQHAGRKAKCKGCGADITVPGKTSQQDAEPELEVIDPLPLIRPAIPQPTTIRHIQTSHQPAVAVIERPTQSASAPTPKPKLPVRTRRLMAESVQMAKAFANFPLIQVKPVAGDPPEIYDIEYHINGLGPGKGNNPAPRSNHKVRIELTSEYPRQSPKCKMLTPSFHPNIDPATICVGDHWTAGERLVDLVIRIGEMITYQAYNIKSPLDGQAAMWADLHPDQLPIDNRDLRPPDLE